MEIRREIGYQRRALGEIAMWRFKSICGREFSARKLSYTICELKKIDINLDKFKEDINIGDIGRKIKANI